MPHLYVNSRGVPWRKHSYSAGLLFAKSPFAYQLQKIQGWRVRDNWARFEFGKTLEASIQFFHDHDGNAERALKSFTQNWEVFKDKQLQYTKVERDWSTLLKTGTEMLRLYFIRQPKLPIPLGANVSFQRELSKEVFPGDPNYGEISDAGRLDIIAHVRPDHYLLPKVEWKPEYGKLRSLIIDIKTSGVDFKETQGLAAYDSQLRRYSWLSGIRDVAFLWFAKKGHSFEKGSSVTLLADVGAYKAGQEAVIAYIQGPVKPTKKEPDKQPPLPLGIYLVNSDFMIGQMNDAQGRREDGDLDTTNEAKEKKYAWLRQFGTLVKPEDITKQRLQFNAGFVTRESADDMGVEVGNQIIAIVNAWNSQTYPNTFSIRYPKDDSNDPYFRAFVLKDEAFKKENFTKSDDAEFDDMFDEEPPSE